MTVQGGTAVGIGTVLLGGATGTAFDPGAVGSGVQAVSAPITDPTAVVSHLPSFLAFTGASHLGLLITAAAVLLMAGLLLVGLVSRHRPLMSLPRRAGVPQWTGRDRSRPTRT